MGHPCDDVFSIIKDQYPYVKGHSKFPCDACQLGKQSKFPFPNDNNRSSSMFSIVHVDIWGPLNVECIHNHRYFLNIVDDFSRHTWIHLMKHKSETKHLIEKFLRYVQNQFDTSVKCIRSNNGVEFQLHSLYHSNGIVHQTSCVETPEQNSVVEHKHRHILNVARSIIFCSNMPKSYWCFDISYAVHIINLLPSRFLKKASPYQLLFGKSPTLMHVKVFGCLC
jgi:hypothetical protein